MSFHAKAHVRIDKPISEVFDAVVNPDKISKYFVSSASASMIEGTTVTWSWADVGASGTVHVEKVELDNRIVFQWPATPPNSNVELTFESLPDGATKVSAKETGNWTFDLPSVEAACGQTGGWMHMLLCLKAYLVHGINLREGAVCK